MATDLQLVMQTKAADIEDSPNSDHWCGNWWNVANFTGRKLDTIFTDFGTKTPNYCQPQYIDDGHTYKIYPRNHGFNGHIDSPGQPAPCPAGALPSSGTDGQMDIHCANGDVVSYWAFSSPRTPGATNPWAPLPQWHGLGDSGFNISADAVVGSCTRTPANLKGNSTTWAPAIPIYVGVPTPDEVASGVIPHALTMSVSRACSMSGPKAPLSITDPDQLPAQLTAGVAMGCSASPARMLESTYSSTLAQLLLMVPDGMRLVVNKTDAQIEQWLTSRGYKDPIRTVARIFCVCLRDYGIVQAQTGGGASIPCDGSVTALPKWKTLGISSSTDLLHGYITRDSMVAKRPPASTLASGQVIYREGEAVSISY